ncbi:MULTISPECIES: UDP-glucose 4-epimerase GalE [Vagococcus]|uniref:UDP-glucose 4-epimerase n=1 Tax=Vagococcus fluvialis bH819 TaxID=1255619 RepID=A0A1X6WR71_9ENTE|nr:MULTISPECIES: UDP-glucose 4-epimerase GalE [Vagococcus]SLM86758.1 UDP-glucose 4-epimerase [Vagococcus fluvialis bH819]HCM88782.1 UDP-glucose 4-epimerase GalE [Vagococcus sp.]
MSIAVLGGAGYIGSHAVQALINKNEEVVVIDNLLTGHKEAVHKKAKFFEGDIRDKDFMLSVFKNENVTAVVHFAASSLVGESVVDPLKYFNNNVYGTQVTLEVMKELGIKKIVFSSTAATYGETTQVPIYETTPTNPKNPYGESKLMMEKMMHWCDDAYGIKFVALRYFNVAGASLDGSIGEDHNPETHLVPIILQTALGQRESIAIFGEDYDTADGTCVRDYVHVVDLGEAHVLALDYLNKGNESNIFNLGSNEGFSVKQMVEEARKITGKEIPAVVSERRAGDPAILVASPEKAKKVLGWEPKSTNVTTILETAWKWHVKNPTGY